MLNWPDEDTLIECFKDEIGSDIEKFKTWYSLSLKTMWSTEPLFTEDYVLNYKVVTQIYTTMNGNKAYYKGGIDCKG